MRWCNDQPWPAGRFANRPDPIAMPTLPQCGTFRYTRINLAMGAQPKEQCILFEAADWAVWQS